MKSQLKSNGDRSWLGVLALAGLVTVTPASVFAADIFWQGGPASYTNAASWNTAAVPGVADKAINDNGAGNTVQINAGNPDWIVNGIFAGRSTGNGAFVQNGQNVYLTNAAGRGAVRLGVAPGRTGAYTLNDGTLNYTGDFNVGELGTGTLNVNGGSITGSGNLAINVGSSLDGVTATYGGTNKSDYTWFEQGFFTLDPSRGIPPAGSTFASETLPDHSFTMPASYAVNNAVQVFNGVSNATINFTTPTAATALSFLGSAGFGTANVNYTVHHADATTQSGTLALLDWFSNDGVVAARPGSRISANGLDGQIINDGPNKPYLLSLDLAIANTASAITSVDLTYTSGGVANILAVSSSSGGNFTPQAITGYNQDIVVEAGAPIYVSSTVTNVLNQTAGSINITGEMFVGNVGAGIYNLSGGTNTVANYIGVGRSGGNGVVNMTGGVLNHTGGGNLILGTPYQNLPGHDVTGVLNQSGGTINMQSGQVLVPEESSPFGTVSGTYNLSGTAVMNVGDWFVIGRNGASGTMNMTGGTINKTGGGQPAIIIADGGGAVGKATQSAGYINCSSEFWIGQGGGSGTYNLSGGSISVGNWIAIGRQGGNGTLNLTNGLINKVDSGNFAIGSGGGGTLNQYGGVVSNRVNAGSITYLAEAGGTGNWYLHGGTAALGTLQFCQGGNGSGTLYLNGGLLNVSEVNCGLTGANGQFFFNGGKLQANADNANFFHGLGAAYIDAGGAVIDSQGFNVTMAQTLTDFGGGNVTKLGSGRLALTGFNGYAGATIVSAGTLAVTTDSSAGSTGGYTVANGAKLAVKVQTDEAQLNTASVAFNGSASTLEVDLGNFGNPTAAPVNLSGILTVNGTVTINLLDTQPQYGQFPLIKYGTKSGAGSFVIGSLPVGVVASLVNNTANGSIDINITTVNAPRWDGQDGGNWDVGVTANWINIGDNQPTTFAQGNPVIFDDQATGTTTANLVATVTPASVTFNNESKEYTLTGSGKISGSTGLTKNGAAMTTIANTTANDFTGKTLIAGGGILNVAHLANGGAPSAIGASSANATNLVLDNGTLVYAGPAVAINRGYAIQGAGGSIQTYGDLSLSGPVTAGSGSGFIKGGPGQLAYKAAGNNFLTGTDAQGYQVTDGSVVFDGTAGGQTNILQGGVLAVSGMSANATIVMTNTTVVTAGNLEAGNLPGATSTLTVYSNSTVNVGSWFILGDGGNGVSTANLNGGTINVNNGRLFLGSAPGTMTTLNINGGTINKNGDYFAIVDGGWNGVGARTGVVNQVSGTVASGSEMWVGDRGGAGGNDSLGVYNLSGGTLTVNNWMGIGRDGSRGTFNMTGGTLTKGGGGDLVIGRGTDNTVGTFNMSGGTLNKGSGNPLIIGQNSGHGLLNQSGGTLTVDSEYWVGVDNNTTDATNIISGTAMLNINNWVSLGRGGRAVVNFSGGSFTKGGDGNFIVGDNGTGQFNQSGSAALQINSQLWIAQAGGGVGEFNLSGGTVTNNSWLAVGREGGKGTLNISGGTMVKSGDGNISITHGGGASGTVNQTGGTFINASGETWIGEDNGPGIWNISAGSATHSLVVLARDGTATGTLNLNGGTFAANEVAGGNGNTILNLNGGTLVARVDNANFVHDIDTASVLAGGAIINTGTNSVDVNQALLDGTGGGGLAKNGTGTLRLNGVNTYTGTTVVNAGTLGGVGTIAGPVTVAAAGSIGAGTTSIGTLTINNSLTLAAGSTAFFKLAPGSNDQITGLTSVNYNNAALVVTNISLTALTPGSVVKLFNAAVPGTGNFASVTILPVGTGTFNPATGELTIVTSAPPVVDPPVYSGGHLILTGTGGAPGGSYTWLTSTNVTAPVSNWITNSTGNFNGVGAFSNAIPVNPLESARFFRLKTP